jgi:hypothetical protein
MPTRQPLLHWLRPLQRAPPRDSATGAGLSCNVTDAVVGNEFSSLVPNLSSLAKQLMIQTETFQAVAVPVSNVNTARLSQPRRIICF